MRWGIKPLRVALLTAFAALLVLPASALAAAPPNDDFADREVLAGVLPITSSGSNLEATKEPEEPAFGGNIFGNGHTIWYEWEATSTGFVTVNTCNSGMRAVIAVFTGTALNDLTEAAGDFATQGPDCTDYYGEAVTFRAVSGTTYVIGIDGSSPFPEEEHPGQGPVDLEILQTPAPANDDFADAQMLSGGMLGLIYSAGAEGHNWNATKEPGEPAHSGDPGGASVWYSWTAPETGRYAFSCGGRGTEIVFALYTGASIDALTPVAGGQCMMRMLDVTQGTTYRLAIDGSFDSGTGAARASVFSVNIWREPAAPPTWREPPWIEGRWVSTSIRKRLMRPKQRSATFVFGASEPGARFICKLDKRPEKFCTSPKTYRRLKPGKHVFRVAAIGDTTPAIARFQIPKPKPRPKR